MKARVQSAIEIATNLAILSVCILLAFTIVQHRKGHVQDGSLPHNSLLVGSAFPPIPEYDWSSHPKTLVIAIRKGCRYCEQSLPFYSRLSQLARAGKLRVHLLAILPDSAHDSAVLVHSSLVDIEDRNNQNLQDLQVDGTPTLALVDSTGKIARLWFGEVAPAQQDDLVRALQ